MKRTERVKNAEKPAASRQINALDGHYDGGMSPGPEPFHRRYWRTYNRPYSGCGCLWLILIILLIWWIISWFYVPARVWY